jgi:hypothetical protein
MIVHYPAGVAQSSPSNVDMIVSCFPRLFHVVSCHDCMLGGSWRGKHAIPSTSMAALGALDGTGPSMVSAKWWKNAGHFGKMKT